MKATYTVKVKDITKTLTVECDEVMWQRDEVQNLIKEIVGDGLGKNEAITGAEDKPVTMVIGPVCD